MSVRIRVFRRRGDAPRPSAALLRSYLARAQTIADAGGGNLWLIEPAFPTAGMSSFTATVVRPIAGAVRGPGAITVLDGRTSARIAVLAAPAIEIALPVERV